MGVKPKYPKEQLKLLLYRTKREHPGRELNPYNLAKLTNVPLSIWRDRMKPEIELINDAQYIDDFGMLKPPEELPFPIVNYFAEFSFLLKKGDNEGALTLARELSILHLKMLNEIYDLNQRNKTNLELDIQKEKLELLTKQFKASTESYQKNLESLNKKSLEWEQKYKDLAVRATRNIRKSKNDNVIELAPFTKDPLTAAKIKSTILDGTIT
ncbi:hypothetical protein [Paenibacillus pedocola]|uniref:hypothetical protein n=1 Tax=Paenibacillus pedocola TaxID=3242193 RepID=UPI002877286A|nr:hypothetical protein [Paenibacillus typhae]